MHNDCNDSKTFHLESNLSTLSKISQKSEIAAEVESSPVIGESLNIKNAVYQPCEKKETVDKTVSSNTTGVRTKCVQLTYSVPY